MLSKPETCDGCPLFTLGAGFMAPDGDGSSGIMLVGEALGKTEAKEGGPFKGAAGFLLNRALERAGIPRPSLTITNVLWCQPPGNELLGAPYEAGAKAHCWPRYSRPVIARTQPRVIVTLGRTATEQLLGPFDDLEEVRGFPAWHHQHQAWVIPTYHPSYIQRGKFNLEAVLIHDLQRAAEIARDGYTPRWGHYLLDVSPQTAMAWARRTIEDGEGPLSFDGEWDRKTGRMTRLGFSREGWTGMSLPWRQEYFGVFRYLLSSPVEKLAWNKVADITALANHGFEVAGHVIDAMVAWHILNTDLPKALDYVATFMAPEQPRWAHLAGTQPALYNAVDADVTRRIYLRVREELIRVGRWEIFERHVLVLDHRLEKMSAAGMPVDPVRRRAAALQVDAALEKETEQIAAMIPDDIRPVLPKFGYVRTPKDTSTLVRRTFEDPKVGTIERWARLVPLKLSWQLILAYQKAKGHKIQYKKVKGRGRRPTTDEHALRTLALLYPDDPLYTQLVTVRKLKQLRGTFIGRVVDGEVVGGLEVGRDHRAHPHFNHNPSTLRVATDHPTLQNLPRPTDDWARLVKGMFVAPQGFQFEARDYAGIEAVLVGYFARSQPMTRLALLDIHTFVTAWWMYEDGRRLKYSELPQLKWSDGVLRDVLASLKKRLKTERQGVKPQVHAVNYMARARKVQEILFDELGWTIPVKQIRRFLQFYKELFPEIPRFHERLLAEVEGIEENGLHNLKTGVNWIQNPFGYLHRYHQVVRWQKVGGEWDWGPGPGANELASFPAQSTAAAIAKEAILTFEEEHPALVDGLRLFIHDELLGEWPVAQHEEVHAALQDVMERPISCMPLPPEWNMGACLRIYTDGKTGPIWGEMKGRA